MKKILIITLCFISLINAADSTKEIILQINGKNCKGYYLKQNESEEYSFIGYTTENNFNICLRSQVVYTTIVGQRRDDPARIESGHMPLMEVLNEQKYLKDDRYQRYLAHEDSSKALVLCNLYMLTHAKRTFSVDSKK